MRGSGSFSVIKCRKRDIILQHAFEAIALDEFTKKFKIEFVAKRPKRPKVTKKCVLVQKKNNRTIIDTGGEKLPESIKAIEKRG